MDFGSGMPAQYQDDCDQPAGVDSGKRAAINAARKRINEDPAVLERFLVQLQTCSSDNPEINVHKSWPRPQLR